MFSKRSIFLEKFCNILSMLFVFLDIVCNIYLKINNKKYFFIKIIDKNFGKCILILIYKIFGEFKNERI